MFKRKAKIKNKMSKTAKLYSGVLFYAICGLLLLLFPQMPMQIANYTLSIGLVVIGIIFIIDYFSNTITENMLSLQLGTGLISMVLGLLLLFNPSFLSGLIPTILGFSLIVGACHKVQMAMDLHRISDNHWWFMLIAAVISLVLGMLAMIEPTFITAALFQFIGISLIVEAFIDAGSIFTLNKKMKKYKDAVIIDMQSTVE